MRRLRSFAPVVVSLALTLGASNARADDEPSPADIGAARALGQEGVKLADAGNCADAIDRLVRAEKLYHAPTTLGRLGECQVAVGKIVEGSENLNRVARESLGASPPPAFVAAQERAKRALAEAKPKIAKLRIAVTAPAGTPFTVTVDGENVPRASLEANRPTDPGAHVVEASASGYVTASATVRLGEGASESVALRLVPEDASGANGALVPTEPLPPPDGSRKRSNVPAFIVLGAGAAGLGVGAVFGIMALGKKGDLDDACGAGKVCPASQRDTIDSGQTFGTVSTIGFAVGIVGVGIGTYLLLTNRAKPSTIGVRPSLNGLVGTF